MTKVAHQTWPGGSLPSRLRQAGSDLALALVSLTTLATTASWLFQLPVGYFAQVAAAYMVLACLGPIISPALATGAAAAALVVLVYSFAVDIIWLARWRPDRRGA